MKTDESIEMTTNHIADIRGTYESNINKELATKMATYMKDKFPFLGIPSPLRTELNKDIFKNYDSTEIIDIEATVNELWALPEREYQYLAIALLNRDKKKLTPSNLEFLLDLIRDKSWWDTVDALAPNFIGYILLNYPELQDEYIPSWVESDNIWINRTAILFQLKYKSQTDFDLMKSIIDSLKHKKEFFVKKAIGWALRECSKTNPQIVEEYIKTANLQALSEKEGLKHILKNRDK